MKIRFWPSLKNLKQIQLYDPNKDTYVIPVTSNRHFDLDHFLENVEVRKDELWEETIDTFPEKVCALPKGAFIETQGNRIMLIFTKLTLDEAKLLAEFSKMLLNS